MSNDTRYVHRRGESIAARLLANRHTNTSSYLLSFWVLDPLAGAEPPPTARQVHIPLVRHPFSQSHVNTILPAYRSETYIALSSAHYMHAYHCEGPETTITGAAKWRTNVDLILLLLCRSLSFSVHYCIIPHIFHIMLIASIQP